MNPFHFLKKHQNRCTLIYSFFTVFNFPLAICHYLYIFELFNRGHGAPYTSVETVVNGTHSGWCWWERSKVELEYIVFCLDLLVLNKVLVKEAQNDFFSCFSWLGISICYSSSISALLYMYIHYCVLIMFKIWYITIILCKFLLCALHLMQGFL